MKTQYLLTLVLLFFYSCEDKCDDVAVDYGTTDLYNGVKKIFEPYKNKKSLILKNEKGDTIKFNITYSVTVHNDTIADTYKKSKVCTADVRHLIYTSVELSNSENSYFFYIDPVTDINYTTKVILKKYDGIAGGWVKGGINEINNFSID